MEYRGLEFRVVLGIDKKRKWFVGLASSRRQDEARVRDAVIRAAQAAIDRALN
jgi:hypothetical protein